MRPKKYGKIINMSSIAAKACLGGFSVYSATKAAVLAATASLGREAALESKKEIEENIRNISEDNFKLNKEYIVNKIKYNVKINNKKIYIKEIKM